MYIPRFFGIKPMPSYDGCLVTIAIITWMCAPTAKAIGDIH